MKKQLMSFKFHFKGMALGGEAIVIAHTQEEEARDILDSSYPGLQNVRCEDAPVPAIGVFHFWDGDY